MADALCKRFYEIDFNVSTTSVAAAPHTALLMASRFDPSSSIATLIHTAVNIDLPRYKNSVRNLLLDLDLPNVLISIIGLYAFF